MFGNSGKIKELEMEIKALQQTLDRLTNYVTTTNNAKQLIKEYKKLGGNLQLSYNLVGNIISTEKIRRENPWGGMYDYDIPVICCSLDKFECEVICELRKQRLKELESK